VTESRCPACTCIGFHTSDCTRDEMTLRDRIVRIQAEHIDTGPCDGPTYIDAPGIDERRRPVSARKPARWLIRRSASAWRWQIIDTHATEWADYVRLETITGAEAVAAFARGGR
jgi:hypothetical protein